MGEVSTAVRAELNRIGRDLECERGAEEIDDDYGWRLVALVEDDIDRPGSLITDLDNLRAGIVALISVETG
jgi:hypothetical protein